jgi:hypothetical protein
VVDVQSLRAEICDRREPTKKYGVGSGLLTPAKAALRKSDGPKPDQCKRVGQLRLEVQNLTDGIAGGLLRTSPAVAQRLQAAEDVLVPLEAVRGVKRSAIILRNIRTAYFDKVAGIDQVMRLEPERGREELRGILAGQIKPQPDESGQFLWADYSLEFAALLPRDTKAEIMVAGAGFGRYLHASRGA